jgi:hypothetical protein
MLAEARTSPAVILAPYGAGDPKEGEMTVATTEQTITEREAAQVERFALDSR